MYDDVGDKVVLGCKEGGDGQQADASTVYGFETSCFAGIFGRFTHPRTKSKANCGVSISFSGDGLGSVVESLRSISASFGVALCIAEGDCGGRVPKPEARRVAELGSSGDLPELYSDGGDIVARRPWLPSGRSKTDIAVGEP